MPKTNNPLAKQRSGASTNIILTAIVLVVALLVIGGVLLIGRGESGQSTSSGNVPASVLHPKGSNTVLEAGGDAPTLVEFVDFQCPSCRAYYQSVTSKIEKEYDGKINFVVRNYPLQMHPLAEPAAKAVEAAAMQGKFKPMYHKVFDGYGQWAAEGQSLSENKQRAVEQFRGYAKEIGLDVDKFSKDMNSDQVAKQIERDKADGNKAGVQGTPTFFLNGQQIQFSKNTNPLQKMREELDGALAK